MEVLKSSVNYLTLLGILPQQLDDPTHKFYKLIRTYIILIGHTCPVIIASVVYIIYHLSDFTAITRALVMFSSGVSCFGAHMWFGLQGTTVRSLCIDFREIVATVRGGSEPIYYTEAERKSTKYVKTISLIFLMQFTTGVIGMTIVNAIYNFYSGNHHPETWYLPHAVSLPFDRTTYTGYVFCVMSQAMGGYTYLLSMTAIVTFFIANCFYIQACIQHLQSKIMNLDKIIIKVENKKKVIENVKNEQKAIEQLHNIVEFQVAIFKIHEKLRTIGTGPIFFQLMSNAIFFAASIVQIAMTESLLVELGFFVLCLSSALTWTYLYCYYATQTNLLMVDVANTVWNVEWYTYPTHIRKYLLLIMFRSRVVVDFHGFKILGCSLETFKKMLNASMSYAVMIRNLLEH